MNFINRAFRNVTRKLSKSLLILLTFFVIGNFVIIGLGISEASEHAKVITRQSMNAIITYETDYEAYFEAVDAIEDEDERNEFFENNKLQFSLSDVKHILEDPRVKVANVLSSNIVHSVNFDHVLVGNEENKNSGGSYVTYDNSGNQIEMEYHEPNILLQGNFLPSMIEIEDDTFNIVEGRFYTQEEIDNNVFVALITDKMAEQNNLTIGDTIELSILSPSELESALAGTHPFYSVGYAENALMEYEIIGIYDNTNEVDPSAENFDWMGAYESPENIVLVPSSTINYMNYLSSLNYYESFLESNPEQAEEIGFEMPVLEDYSIATKMIILLNDPLDVEDFYEEYQSENTNEFLFFDANNDEFKRLSRPLDTISLYATFIVYLVLFNAVIIITLITAITLKTREYEIGVLLSLGATKIKIIAQFFVELTLIALLGFTLSVVSGSLIANNIGASLLEYTVSTSDNLGEQEEEYNFYYYGNVNYFTEITIDDMLAGYDVSISLTIIGQIYIAGLIVIFISIIIPSLMIMRFNPKRILTNTE